jgi:cytochrome c oxidase subunit 2
MKELIANHVPALSTYALDVDGVIILVGVLVGFWYILCNIVFFGFIFRYRAKPGQRSEYITGEEKELKRWVTIPHLLVLVCDLFIIYGAVRVWVEVKQTLPETPYATVRIVGQQWAWSFVHPGADGKLDTPDDIKTVDDLHIVANKPYIYELVARDVLHDFSVPVFRLKQDAIPGRTIRGWFQATDTGVHDIQCAEICGIGHGIMLGRIHITTEEQHAAWIAANTPAQLASAPAALPAQASTGSGAQPAPGVNETALAAR